MKKIILLCLMGLSAATLPAGAQSFTDQLQRNVYAAAQDATSKVQVHFKWKKPVYMSDVMFRRPRTKDMIIRWDQKTTTCAGIVSAENRVYFVADCLEPGSFEFEHLKEVQVTFANGEKVVGGKNTIGRHDEVAWMLAPYASLQGVHKLTVLRTPKGQSLQDAYGETMTRKLKSFFRSKNIPARSHRCRIGYSPRSAKLAVGDPVIIDGKLVALVKYIPSSYQGLLGGVSENSLAVIH